MSHSSLCRRRVLGVLSAFFAAPALSLPASARAISPTGGDDAAGRLSDMFSRPQSAIFVGREYLRRHPEDADADMLRRRIAERSGIDPYAGRPATGAAELREKLRDAVQRDFEAGRTRTLDGVVLAETELDLCALGALMAG